MSETTKSEQLSYIANESDTIAKSTQREGVLRQNNSTVEKRIPDLESGNIKEKFLNYCMYEAKTYEESHNKLKELKDDIGPVQGKEYRSINNAAKEIAAIKNIKDLKLPKAEQNKILAQLKIYEQSPKCKVIDNLSKLNSEQTKEFYNYCDKDFSKAFVYLSLADNPKDIINEKFRESVKEESRSRNEEITKLLESSNKKENTNDLVNKLLKSDRQAYTTDQLLVLSKMREEQNIPVICGRVQNKEYENLNLPDKRQVFIFPLEDIMGQRNEDVRKILGFPGADIKNHKAEEYNIYTMKVASDRLGRVGWDDVQNRVEEYLEKLKNSKDPDDRRSFNKIAKDSGFDSGDNWKKSFKEKVLKPIREHVPTEEGYDKLNDGCKIFCRDVLEKNFGINRNFTGCQISATVGEGIGGSTEYVINVPYDEGKEKVESVVIPCV